MDQRDAEQARQLVLMALRETERLVRELSPEQIEDLIEGRAGLALVPADGAGQEPGEERAPWDSDERAPWDEGN